MESTYRKARVIMLPSTNLSDIVLVSDETLGLITEKMYYDLEGIRTQHLYAISDDPIKEGDYFYMENNNAMEKCTHSENGRIYYQGQLCNPENDCKKLPATSDFKLRMASTIRNSDGLDINYGKISYILPKLPQEFIKKYIEAYNRNEIITDILVEHELDIDDNFVDNAVLETAGKPYSYQDSIKLKIDSKDNTISIKQLKNNWNRAEVIKKLRYFEHFSEGRSLTTKEFDDWIMENI